LVSVLPGRRAMDNGARKDDVGYDFELTEPADMSVSFSRGGIVRDWVPLENALMRRKITYVLLALLPFALIACVYLALRGTPVFAVAAAAMVVTVPLSVVVRYYFYEAAK
jgi:hypothetical protein